jgi:hypothetical protein
MLAVRSFVAVYITNLLWINRDILSVSRQETSD